MYARSVYWFVRALHRVGVHVLCREVRKREYLEPAAMKLPDGTLWKPDLNGVLGFTTRRWHEPRF